MTTPGPGFELRTDDQDTFFLLLRGDWVQGTGSANFDSLRSELGLPIVA